MKVKIPVFCKDENLQVLEDIDIDYKISQCEPREFIFYRIDVVSPYFEDYDESREFAEIVSGGLRFWSPLTVKEVESLIDAAI